MTILINRKTRQQLVINSEAELTLEIKKVSKYFKQINDLNRHLFACLHVEPFLTPPDFYAKLKEVLNINGSGTKVNEESLVSSYGWTEEETKEWRKLFSTRTNRHLEKTGKDKDTFHKQNSQFTVDFWLKKGFSEEEAKEKISKTQSMLSCRIAKEDRSKYSRFSQDYFKYDGLSKEEKVEIISKIQVKNSPRCLEYWLQKGFLTEEAEKMRSLYQGSRMDGKTEEEMLEINKKKGQGLLNFKSLWTQKFDFPGILYLIEIGEDLFKIGITSKSGVENRYSKKDLLNAHIKLVHTMQDITSAFCIEQIVLRKLKDFRHVKNYGPFGKTEVLNIKCETILNEINSRLDKTRDYLTEELFSIINNTKLKN